MGNFLQGYGICVYSFNYIGNFYSVVDNMKDPTAKRLHKVFKRTTIMLLTLVWVFSFVTYYTLGDASAAVSMFIFRPAFKNSMDLPMVVARLLYLTVLMNAIGLFFNPLKVISLNRFNLSINNCRANILFTVFLTLLVSLMSSKLVNITLLLNFIGGMIMTISVFTVPGLIALKMGMFKH